jgi:hypothetical protein
LILKFPFEQREKRESICVSKQKRLQNGMMHAKKDYYYS